jgi:hypothetical protein
MMADNLPAPIMLRARQQLQLRSPAKDPNIHFGQDRLVRPDSYSIHGFSLANGRRQTSPDPRV